MCPLTVSLQCVCYEAITISFTSNDRRKLSKMNGPVWWFALYVEYPPYIMPTRNHPFCFLVWSVLWRSCFRMLGRTEEAAVSSNKSFENGTTIDHHLSLHPWSSHPLDPVLSNVYLYIVDDKVQTSRLRTKCRDQTKEPENMLPVSAPRVSGCESAVDQCWRGVDSVLARELVTSKRGVMLISRG